ncbi:MAG: PIN domain-containing protein [Solirubrobacteraceae bacterium]
MVLPDTSAWIEYLRAERERGEARSLADQLDVLIEQQQVLTCGPVAAELIAGARGAQREGLAAQLAGLPWVELKRSDWLTVGQTAAELRERGETVPLIDIQIAVCAVDGDAELWTWDGDFERVARALDGLRLRLLAQPVDRTGGPDQLT